MKKLIYYIITYFIGLNIASAQTYGNEWVDFNQKYYKIKVGQEGIYRLTYDNLNSVGFPVSTIIPKRIQLFHRGKEVAINVVGQNDGVFNLTDYVEFYGQANDGTLDAELYQPSSAQPHNYYNLYSDTTAYFLTYYLVDAEGKRMPSPVNPYIGGVNDTYHLEQNLTVFTDQYSQGVTFSSYSSLTAFDVGEGFTGTKITENTNPIRDIVLTNIIQTVGVGVDPQLNMLLVGRNYQTHSVTIEIGPSTGALTVLGTYEFDRFNTLLIDEPIPWSSLSGTGELTVRVTVNDNGGLNSNISVSYVRLNYAQDFDMNLAISKKYYLQTKVSGGNEIRVINPPASAKVYDITYPDSVLPINYSLEAPNIIKCGFSDATLARVLLIKDNSFIEPIITPISFRQLNTTANYVIISHNSLMKPVAGYSDAVRAYAGYRTTASGGSFDTLVVDIEQLYNQFSYGEITPLSIYRFMRYMIDKGNPQYLFLIGKALLVENKFHRRPISDFNYYDLVPTAGQPGSDIAFTAGLNGTAHEAAVPTGRLDASNPQEIINYLNKVIEQESTPFDKLWRKNLLHLSGGNSELELVTFRDYVDGYKNIASGLYLGGETTTQSKTTSAAVEFINVSTEVNSGVNQITFFGHSAPNVTDIDIGFVSDPANGYNNKGKYPLVLMNGCNAGNIFNNSYIFGEDWVLTPNLGSTTVIAHTAFGFSNVLDVWSSLFYSIGYGDLNYMDKSIGKIMQEVGKQMSAIIGVNINYNYIAQIQQMALQGDPALQLFGTQLPDYELSKSNVEPVALTNLGVTAEADSFALRLNVRNFAAYLNNPLEVFVRRILQNGTIIDYDTIAFNPVRYWDTLEYVIDNKFEDNFGTNSFEIVLDPSNKLDEINEFNNRIFFNYFIPLSGSINLSPSNYSIQSNPSFALKAQTSIQPSEVRSILYQIDSVRSTINPSLLLQSGSANGSLITAWSDFSGLPLIDSTAYFWRTKYQDLQPGEADVWSESSFTYINNGDEGWAQVNYSQFKDNSLSGLVFEEGTKSIQFEENPLHIEVKTYGAVVNQASELLIDGQAFILGTSFQSCSNNRLAIIAFDNKSAVPYAPIYGGQVDAWTCGRSPQVINIVNEGSGTGKTLDEVLDAVADKDFVLVFTIGSFDFNAITGTSLVKLENLGADVALLLAKAIDEPYLMLGQKGVGAGNSLVELVANPASSIPTNEQFISYQGDVIGIKGTGSMKSVLIGPSLSWSKLNLDISTANADDTYNVDIVGKSLDGKETSLATGINLKETLIDWIDATQYPYLQLTYNVLDTSIYKTPVQLTKWIVTHTLAPEGVLVFLGNDAENKLDVEINEGDSLISYLGFINSSDKEFKENLKVDYTVFNTNQRTSVINTIEVEAPLPGDTAKFSVPIKTKGLVGVNNLSVSVNNLIQPEQLYVNNNLSITNYVTVIKDNTNPLLDVSFDGRYIFDGEIVSPSPSILVKILDVNPLLTKTDTAGIHLFLTPPCETCSPQRITLNGITTNATKDTPFEINYNPKQLENGLYTLSVQVEDASGNKAGLEPYVIHFEVVNEASVTNFYPYPNPFSTSVQFVFTLTGTVVPDGIKIRILTVSGRGVRTITQDELGPIFIGNNKTDFAWDGRDEYGDQLANGVYLYKVYLTINGEQVELRSSAGDKGFKNGYGKLYLLR